MISRGVLLEQPMPKNAVVDHSDKDGVLRPVCVRSSLLGGPVPQGRGVLFAFEHVGFGKVTSNFQFRTARWHVACWPKHCSH